MDSRIREIEMRLARAKEGLSEGGREEYLNQLYLLDAEIKAVIKENGSLPQALESKRQRLRRRNLTTPALQYGMAFATVILAATVTYAAFQVADAGAGPVRQGAETAIAAIPVTEAIHVELPQPTVVVSGVPDTSNDQDTTAVTSVLADSTLLASSALVGADALESTPGQSTGEEAPGLNTPTAPSNPDGPQVVAANYIPPMEDTPAYQATGSATKAAAGVVPSGVEAGQVASGQEGFDWTIARFALPGLAKQVETEEIEVVNQLKEKLSESAESSE